MSIPNTMPKTQEEWSALVQGVFQKEQEQYQAECEKVTEAVTRQYEAEMANREIESSESEEGQQPLPNLEKMLAEAFARIPEPMTQAQIEEMYACYYPKVTDNQTSQSFSYDSFYRLADGRVYSVAKEDFTEDYTGIPINVPGGTVEDLKKLLQFYQLNGYSAVEIGDCLLTPEQVIVKKRIVIDETTSLNILGGFDYEINGETLHFSYDAFDQQNFADTANACLMKKAGAEGLPDTINWNAYRESGELVRLVLTADEFLALYAGGALAHKARCMEQGGIQKAELV